MKNQILAAFSSAAVGLLLCVLLAVLGFAPEAVAFKQTGPRSVQIHVLSYNIRGLPAAINPQYDTARYGDIGRELQRRKQAGTAPDIVLLQESFDAKTADLRVEAKYPYVAQGPASQKLLNSGLFILSNFPIQAKSTILYGDADCGTWDCFAAKGAQAVRVQIPGVPYPLTLINTHTQSGKSYEKARSVQLKDLAQYVRDVFPTNVGAILGGDLNTRPAQATFGQFEKDTGLTSVGRVCLSEKSDCSVANGTDRKMILENSVDHFFISPGTVLHVKPLKVGRTFSQAVRGRVLSDHLGYEAIYELSW